MTPGHDPLGVALLVGELYARVTAHTGDARAELKRFDDEARRVADRTGINFARMAKVIAASLGGIGGAAAAAGAATAGALGGVPLLFMGIAAAAVASKEEVQDAWLGLSEHITSAVRADADSLAVYYINASNRIGQAFDTTLRPQIAAAMQNSAPHVGTLTDGVIALAENAMPGLVKATENAEPVMEGLASLMARAGRASSDFLSELADTAPEAGQSLDHFGALAEGTLPSIGTLVADLTRVWAEHGDEVVAAITKLTSGITSFAGGVLPALGTGLGLAADATGGLLDIVNSAVAGFQELPAPVQMGAAALLAWRLTQDRVASSVSNLGERLVTPWRQVGDEMKVQNALMQMQQRQAQITGGAYGSLADRLGHIPVAMDQATGATGRHSAALDTLRAKFPTLDNMVSGYQRVAGETRAYADQAYKAGAASDSLAASVKGSALQAMAPFSGAVNGAATAVGQGLKGAASGLVGLLGGPWGAALVGATTLITMWMQRSQEAAQKQKALADAGKEVAAALKEQGGAFNSNVRAVAAKKAEETGLLTLGRKLGIQLPQITDALDTQGAGYSNLRDRLNDIIAADTKYISVGGQKDGIAKSTTKTLGSQGLAAQDLLSKLDGLTGGMNNEIEAHGRVKEAIEGSTTAMYGQKDAVPPLKGILDTLGDTAKTTSEKISSIKAELDKMTQDKHSLEEATQAVNDSLRGMGDAFKAARDEAGKSKQPMLDSSGAINTVTKAGSDLQNQVMSLTTDLNGQVAAIVANANATGKQLPAAAREAEAAVQKARDAFIKNATAAGMARDEAEALADRYGLMPKIAATQILQPGMPQAQLDLLNLKARFDAVPNAKSITTSALTQEAVDKLTALGFKVTTLPNGQVRVELPNIAGARAQLDRLVAAEVKNVTVRVTGANATGYGGQTRKSSDGGGWMATGGVVEYFAAGGFSRMRPMSAGSASIVESQRKTGYMRVIGDNPRVPESFIPLDRFSARSQAILTETIRRMRPDLWTAMTRGVLPMAAGSVSGAASAVPEQRGGRSVSYGDIHLHAVQSLPTVQQLRDLTHDMEYLHG